jgi:PTH1 family peptidyl-tRNA hydrolase
MDFLIVGLGNPGREHAQQRHNVGFMVVDRMAERWRADNWKNKFSGEICAATIQKHQVFLLKPQTYMNLSGDSVAQAARFYKIPVDKIIVLHDELDIPFSAVRIKQGGGNGGHNGLRSIDSCMGNANYWRVRIGIDHPGEKYLVTPHVLGNFFAEEQEVMDKVLDGLAEHIGMMLNGKPNDLAKKLAPPAPEKKTGV